MTGANQLDIHIYIYTYGLYKGLYRGNGKENRMYCHVVGVAFTDPVLNKAQASIGIRGLGLRGLGFRL